MLKITCSLPERQIKSELRKIIFKKGRLRCCYCDSHIVKKVNNEDRYYCKKCRKKFSVFSGTWLRHIRIPLTQLIILVELWLNEYTVTQAKQLTDLSVPTIRRYYQLFRKNIVKSVDFIAKNNVQVDEAYFGRFKKQANYFHGWRTYETPQKTCVAGISCPSTGLLTAKVIEGRPGKPIKEFIYDNVPTNVRVYSDGSPIYTLLREDYYHTAQTHDLGFHNAYYIESCWSWMKRKVFKQYHHFSKKYAEEYVSELTWRFNTRKQSENALYYIKESL